MLDHHDRVVDDQADGRRDAAQGHDIEAHVQDIKQKQRGGDDAGHGDNGNQGDFEAAQEDEQNQGRQRDADQNGIPDALGRGEDQFTLVIPIGNMDVFRQMGLVLGQLRFELPIDLHRVAARLLIDLEKDGLLPIGRDPRPFGRRRARDSGHIFNQHHAVPAGAQGGQADAGQVRKAGIGHDQVKLVMILQAPHRGDDIGGRKRFGHFVEGKAEGRQFGRIHRHPVFFLLTAEHTDAGHARHRGQKRPELVKGDIPQLDQRMGVGRHAVGQHGKDRGVHAPDRESGSGGQL